MKLLALLTLLITSVTQSIAHAKVLETLQSPDQSIQVVINKENRRISYAVSKNEKTVLHPSHLGMRVRNVGDLSQDLEVLGIHRSSKNERWEQPWGQSRTVVDNHNTVIITARHAPTKIRFDVEFRAFNDGVAFRYIWPEQTKLTYFELDDEISEFRFEPHDQAWWIPAFQGGFYEFLYKKNAVRDLNVVHTPLTVELANGLTVSIHEARLIGYPAMALKNHGDGLLTSDLVPWADHIDAKLRAPHQSPWRTIQIAEEQKDLIESTMLLNLNDPSVISDTSWINTGKYIGVWWGMHLGKYTWSSGAKHGATTEITKQYIDFAAEHGFKGVLVEGWNYTWDGDWANNGNIFRFDQPYPDWDIEVLSEYARNKGVKLVGHHETAGAVTNYVNQLPEAFDFLNRYGMDVVKTGHVGARLDGREWHDGQYGVDYFTKVMQYAASRKTMLVVHEPIKPTGLERTYPNLMSGEGARGQEYDAWSEGNPPEHTTILPFTRLLAGPMDFTPGTFGLTFPEWRPYNRVQTTLAKQLALMVVIYTPWQMASDLPENYLKFPKAFEFIKNVPTNWEKTKALNSKIGDYTVIARKDRESDRWYLGAVTDEQGRSVTIKLDFLEPGASYRVNAYQDARSATWTDNPYAMEIYSTRVRADGTFDLHLAPGGGTALEFIKE